MEVEDAKENLTTTVDPSLNPEPPPQPSFQASPDGTNAAINSSPTNIIPSDPNIVNANAQQFQQQQQILQQQIESAPMQQMDQTPQPMGGMPLPQQAPPQLVQQELPIIHWDGGLEQCGGDEEFLRELLVDLWSEVQEQMNNIEALGQVTVIDYKRISQVAHAIKGAAANLMCSRMSSAAATLEAAASAINRKEGGPTMDDLQLLVPSFNALKADFMSFQQELVNLGMQLQ
ncbi:hypothetical protein TrLO_g10247 [Triparma laevis f. longispina]|uniref:HPt domain-containing protein n=1 Tax=Triparma laevis f. longispina TaxID=1714387 RepID=A0A9W6ZLY4_9STRA|nr:hypothetical protein TrLO_g10247 [Triparma laevis f. longispina]